MIVITGGAGLIGSALAWALNERGRTDLILVDNVDHAEKQHNLDRLTYKELVSIETFRTGMQEGIFTSEGIEAVFHLGACSSTRETNWDYLLDINVNYTKELIEWCIQHEVPCIYASSAATYGNGEAGYSDAHEVFDSLEPLNLYGKSKLMVDLWARDEGYLSRVVGLRFFNVFGPNEFHKEGMQSLIAKTYKEVGETGRIQLFKSYNPAYADGESRRDFLYVKDAVAMMLFFFDTPNVYGVFNVGSGKAESWNILAQAMGDAFNTKLSIEYKEMPEDMREHYQYFTEADLTKLREAGCSFETRPLTDSVREYIQDYLVPHHHLHSATGIA